MVHLSRELDEPTLEAVSRELSRRHMDDSDYFGLKRLSYYPHDYVRADFHRDVLPSDPTRLPFGVAAQG